MADAHAFKKQSVVADKTEWSVAKVNRLIELYEAHPLLYNTRLKEYHNIHLKNEALKIIAADLDLTSNVAYMILNAMFSILISNYVRV